MSHISCILCGLQKPLKSFDLEKLDLDIQLIQKTGLGRGKGWGDLWRESVLGDDVYTPAFKERILEVLKFFLSEEIVKEEEIKSILNEKGPQIDIQNLPYILNTINKEKKFQDYENDLRRSRYRNSVLLNEIDDQRKENKKIINKYEKRLEINKWVEFAECIIVKYLDCFIFYKGLFDYDIRIFDCNNDHYELLSILNRLLTKEGWNGLMKRVRSMNVEVQEYLNHLTYMKNNFETVNVDKRPLFLRLFSLKNYLDDKSLG